MKSFLAIVVCALLSLPGMVSAPVNYFQSPLPAQIEMTEHVAAAALPEVLQVYETHDGPLVGVSDYIYVNLKAMEITLYRGDMIWKRFPVRSIRAIGSKYDTPKGLFSILTKEPNHFSSIGHVWMPYSMEFDGDFFIHGWPYYPDGTPVPQGYSGGCVRLSDDVAKEVYDFATIGMPVLID